MISDAERVNIEVNIPPQDPPDETGITDAVVAAIPRIRWYARVGITQQTSTVRNARPSNDGAEGVSSVARPLAEPTSELLSKGDLVPITVIGRPVGSRSATNDLTNRGARRPTSRLRLRLGEGRVNDRCESLCTQSVPVLMFPAAFAPFLKMKTKTAFSLLQLAAKG